MDATHKMDCRIWIEGPNTYAGCEEHGVVSLGTASLADAVTNLAWHYTEYHGRTTEQTAALAAYEAEARALGALRPIVIEA